MAGDAVEWLATVSKHCRKMIEIVGVAIRDTDEYETEAARIALREALKAHKEALFSVLPEDFPPSRRGDLARHIGFCEPGDWYDIVLFDIPDILAKAESYAVAMPSENFSGIEEYIHARFRPRLELAMRDGNPDYHALLLTCCVDLATLFQRKSGAPNDSEGEIGRVLNSTNPVLMVPNQIVTDTERNIQRGAMLLMQGWRAFLRNPHAHGERPTDREYAIHSLMLMSFLARILDGATPTNTPP
jgi:Protein of unknown function (Hypoth_ymh)